MRILIMKLEGPMMSFGSLSVDETRNTARHPYQSMIVGMLANGLGLRRYEHEAISNIQRNIEIASRMDRDGEIETDYQTAWMRPSGESKKPDEPLKFRPSFIDPTKVWSTRPVILKSPKKPSDSTIQMWKWYLSDAAATVAVSIKDDDLFDRVVEAVKSPSRPIFLGRKAFLPSRPLFEVVVESENVATAIAGLDFLSEDAGKEISVQYPAEYVLGDMDRVSRIPDLKNWETNLHDGYRDVKTTQIARVP